MTEEKMRQIMREIGEEFGMVDDMDTVPVEVITQLASEMEQKIVKGGYRYGEY